LRDSTGRVLTGRVVTWSSSNPLIATVDPTGGALGVAVGTVTITAAAELQVAQASLTVAATPPPGTNPNEPAGYRRITEQSFDSPTADGWFIDWGSPTFTADAAALVSPSGIVRSTYSAGYRAGSSPWNLNRNLPGPTSLYYRLAFKHSANFQGESSATNKIVFVWMHGNPSIFLSAEGVGAGNLNAVVRLQGVADSREHLTPNLGKSGVISRGVWHTWEVQIISNTPGVANGTARWWLDGVLIGNHTNVQFAGAGQSNTMTIFSVAPIWGGTSGTVTNTMTLDFDNLYVSGP
jgi:hypothetical protein